MELKTSLNFSIRNRDLDTVPGFGCCVPPYAALPPYAVPGGCQWITDPAASPGDPSSKATARNWHLKAAQGGLCGGEMPWLGVAWITTPWLPPHPKRKLVSQEGAE